MLLQSLSLTHFRNHAQWSQTFTQPVTVIVGTNGQGKTAIIEAINLLATGQSFRATHVKDMVAFGQELGRVVGKIGEGDDSTELEVLLTTGLVQGKRTSPRLFSVNGVRRRRGEVVGKVLSVVFRPEDMRLIEGSPSRRRDYLDTTLSQLDHRYAQSLTTYTQALLRRNKLLVAIREGEQSRSGLKYWDLTLLKHGEYIQNRRRHLIEFLNTIPFELPLRAAYQASVMSEERLAKYAEAEVAAGHTLVGPHKDDIGVDFLPPHHSEWVSVMEFGSRGQQRLAVLWLKWGQVQYLEGESQRSVILLLDDILSELDQEHRALVMQLLDNRQVLITTAEPEFVPELERQIDNLAILQL